MENTYNINNEEEIGFANESLDRILEVIKPYLPKPQKAKPVKPGVWKADKPPRYNP